MIDAGSDEPAAGHGVELDPEWDAIFAWSYGPRAWNVGCG
jgi:hypothetical protein